MRRSDSPLLPSIAHLTITALNAIALVHADIDCTSELYIGRLGELEGPELGR